MNIPSKIQSAKKNLKAILHPPSYDRTTTKKNERSKSDSRCLNEKTIKALLV